MAGYGRRARKNGTTGRERSSAASGTGDSFPAPPPQARGTDPELSEMAKKAFDAMTKTNETLQDARKMAENPAKYLREQKKKEKQKKENSKTVLVPPPGSRSEIRSTALLRINQENKFDRAVRDREKSLAKWKRLRLDAQLQAQNAEEGNLNHAAEFKLWKAGNQRQTEKRAEQRSGAKNSIARGPVPRTPLRSVKPKDAKNNIAKKNKPFRSSGGNS
jgi:hypothetical protein